MKKVFQPVYIYIISKTYKIYKESNSELFLLYYQLTK